MTIRSQAWATLLWASLPAAFAVSAEVRIGVARDRRVVVVECGGAEIVAGGTSQLCGAKDSLILWPGPRREVYRVQVAALADDAEARALAVRLAPWGPVEVRRDPATSLTRVQTGVYDGRDAAMVARTAIAKANLGRGFLVGESGDTLRLALTGGGDLRVVASPVVVRSAGDTTVGVDGIRYRGTIEIVARGSQVTVVNALALEAYLRGVVPKEMGPYVYPEVEALQAQAVAARSWAVANLGRHARDGFDLCATAHCQVYGGLDAEVELTDRAVAATQGLVLTAGDRVLGSYFSATCGGHTEDVENVFRGSAPEPWLRGVSCAALEPPLAVPAGLSLPEFRAEDGRAAGGPAAILVAAGILAAVPSAAELELPTSRARVASWVQVTSRKVRMTAVDDPWREDLADLTLGDFATLLARGLGLEERGRVLLEEVDLATLVRACPEADDDTRRAIASLTLLEVWPRLASGRCELTRWPSLGQVLVSLHRVLVAFEAPLFDDGVAVALEEGFLVVRRGDDRTRLALTSDTAMLRESRGDLVALGGTIRVGDGVRYINRPDGARAVVVVEASSGGDDRRARDARWVVTLSRAQLEAKLSKLGTLRELRVAARGVSGRVTQLDAIGTTGNQRLEGYAVKTTLGLKDDLVVIEPVPGSAPGDPPAGFRFLGRGWGHGVGLCQEGAFGMALRGATFDAILSHYFAGAKLRSLDEVSAATVSR